MAPPKEVEIKFLVADLPALEQQLAKLGFHCITPSTHEFNTLYDLPAQELRWKGELLRLRKYGDLWKLTHKARAKTGRHKSRVELETNVGDGKQMDCCYVRSAFNQFLPTRSSAPNGATARATSYSTTRLSETWPRSKALLAGSIEQPSCSAVSPANYITKSYAELFFEWKRKYKRKAKNMTFRECGGRAKTDTLARVPRKPKPAPEFRPRRA